MRCQACAPRSHRPLPGWSVGDIVCTIRLLTSIIRAFQDAKGAKKGYALSCAFLRRLVPILHRIGAQLKDEQDHCLYADYAANAQSISAAYEDFARHLETKYLGLSAKDPSKVDKILAIVRWSPDELNEKVQRFKTKTNDAMGPYQTLIVPEFSTKLIKQAPNTNVQPKAPSRQSSACWRSKL